MHTYGYDVENRLTSVAGPVAMTLTYDPLGRLQTTVTGGATTQYLFSGDQLLAEYDGSGTVLRRYTPSQLGEDRILIATDAGAGGAHYLLDDAQGSVLGYVDATGASGAKYAYGPYGEPNSWTGVRPRYTGQLELPEVSLDYYKARIYDPVRGWFLQTDPAGYDAGLDLYGYTDDDPSNKVDPTGLFGQTPNTLGVSGCNASVPGGCDGGGQRPPGSYALPDLGDQAVLSALHMVTDRIQSFQKCFGCWIEPSPMANPGYINTC